MYMDFTWKVDKHCSSFLLLILEQDTYPISFRVKVLVIPLFLGSWSFHRCKVGHSGWGDH